MPAVARARLDRLGDDLVLEARVAQALGDRGAHHDRGTGLDDRTVARREGEDRVDRRFDEAPQRDELEVRRGPGSGAGPSGSPRASPGASRYPSGAPAAAVTCHESRSSRRLSARSGRRRGTSRRSTRSPARPPDTSTAKWRPRPPRRTLSLKRNSAVARRARRQGHHREPAGHQVDRAAAPGVTPPGARADRGRRGSRRSARS